jgi:DNA (cytosine-5)-methyltransferase 1
LLAVDLFCGAGGMSLGFERAGFFVAAAVDASKVNTGVHETNFPNAATICENVAQLTGATLRRKARLGRRKIAVVFGGPPCQGFSIGGKRKASDPRNRMVLEFARLVVELRPQYFVMENVAGLLRPQHAGILDRFRHRLRKGGYSIVDPILRLNAADFGVPQRRKRAFVLGYRDGEPAPTYPTPMKKRVTVGAAIDDLRCVERAELIGNDAYSGTLGSPSPYARLLRGARDSRRNGLAVITGFARTEHSPTTTQRFKRVTPGGVDPVSRFIRLERTGLAPTLRAGTGLENGRFMAPRPIHPDYHRCICLREAARLHSFPDWFVFHKTKWHGFMQIGNSVPPPLARAVAEEVMKVLGS